MAFPRPQKEKPSTASVLEPRIDPSTNMMDVAGYMIPVTSTLSACLWGFGNHHSLLAKEFFFWRIADMLWNHDNLPEKMFIKHPWAEQIIHECIYNKYLAIGGAASSSKCLAPNTPVRKADGSVILARDVKVGDQLAGDDGLPRNVIARRDGRSNMVRVVPKWGDPWECNDDHIISLKRTWTGPKSYRHVGDIVDISIKDYLKTSNTYRKQHRLFKRPAEMPAQEVPVDPRLYGIWLADGDLDEPIITAANHEQEVLAYLLAAHPHIAKYDYASSGAPKYRFNKFPEFVTLIRESNSSGIKRISPKYLQNSIETRLQLLAGIIDGDGTLSQNNHITIIQKHRDMVVDIKALADSLGFSTSRIKERDVSCPTSYGTYHGKAYQLRISGGDLQLPTLRKTPTDRTRRVCGEEPFVIEQLGEGDWSGFTVDGNSRFLLANGVVTHNSHSLAGYGIIKWLAKPRDTLVLLTSTTLREARKRVWGSVINLLSVIEGAPINIRDSIGAANYVDEKGVTFSTAGLSLIAAEKSRTREAIGKFIGIKQKNVVLIGDELGELSPAIVNAALSNLSKNPQFELKGASNPASRWDAFGDWACPLDGWGSITPEVDDSWATKWGGKYIRLDGERSPNILAGADLYPFLPTAAKLEEDKALLGEKSRAYYRMVRAVFFDTDESDGIYGEAEIVNAGAMKQQDFIGTPTKIAGIDPAFTNGGDRTMVYVGHVGTFTNGQYGIRFEEHYALNDDSTNKAVPRTYQIVHQIRDLCQRLKIAPQNVAVDSTGAGSPFCDVLAGEWADGFLRVQFGGKASDRRVSSNSRLTGEELYMNRVSELWFVGKEFLRTRQLCGISPDLAQEMCARRYEMVKSGTLRMRAESKAELKGRMGNSPDLADAAFIMVDLARQRHGLVAVDPPALGAENPVDFFRRQQRTLADLDVVSRSPLGHLVAE